MRRDQIERRRWVAFFEIFDLGILFRGIFFPVFLGGWGLFSLVLSLDLQRWNRILFVFLFLLVGLVVSWFRFLLVPSVKRNLLK